MSYTFVYGRKLIISYGCRIHNNDPLLCTICVILVKFLRWENIRYLAFQLKIWIEYENAQKTYSTKRMCNYSRN